MSDARIGRGGPEGSTRTSPRRAQLPLLDRLIDGDPAEATDRPLSAAAAMNALRASVGHDLEELLNTRRRWRSWDQRYGELERSLVGFGLPDFGSGAFNDARRREELRQLVEACIHRFEPRITSLRVTLIEVSDDRTGTLRMRIEALLSADPIPEPITFDTLVDLDTKNVIVATREG
jgi:type VI secretion system protein ImpF